MRLKVFVSLLPKHQIHRLLEIGYGSGILMPELTRYCDELYGIDIHPKQQEVTDILMRFNVVTKLSSGSAEAMPFGEGFFDCVVAVSSLEFVENLEAACVEIKRVLKPDGSLVIVTPGHSPIIDFGLKILTGKSAKNDYGDRRQFLIPTLLRYFTIQKELAVPQFGSTIICLYTALRLCPRS